MVSGTRDNHPPSYTGQANFLSYFFDKFNEPFTRRSQTRLGKARQPGGGGFVSPRQVG